jgi:5-methylcytosine-specific restriction enzyme A
LYNKWINEIITAFNNLGGTATLEELYNEILKGKRIDLTPYKDWRAQIRKNIYLHSSDCDIFKGTPGDVMDLFFTVNGKGKGVWGIR